MAAIQPTNDRDAGLSGIFAGLAGSVFIQASLRRVAVLRLLRAVGFEPRHSALLSM